MNELTSGRGPQRGSLEIGRNIYLRFFLLGQTHS